MSHKKPITRRDFIANGLCAAAGYVLAPSIFSLLASRVAYGGSSCITPGASTLPGFICIDLAGGGNIAGSNVIVGSSGSQLNFLKSYSNLGLPSSMNPSVAGMVDTSLGLAFHSLSQMLAGIKSVASVSTMAKVDGFALCAQSMDDSNSNPFNPSYLIAQAGRSGMITSQIGNQASVSGGNSTSPDFSVLASMRPVPVNSPTAAQSLVNLRVLTANLGQAKAASVLSTIQKMSSTQLANFQTSDLSTQTQSLFGCQIQAAANSSQMASSSVDPRSDSVVSSLIPNVNASRPTNSVSQPIAPTKPDPLPSNPTAAEKATYDAALAAYNAAIPPYNADLLVFSEANQPLEQYDNDQQVATIAKLVLDNYAGAGTISLGGYDYHGNPRCVTEIKDFNAGRVIGQCLEMAAKKNKALMIYVCTDGAIGSGSQVADTTTGSTTNGKFNFDGDNGSAGTTFVLMYDPNGKPSLTSAGAGRQVGGFNTNQGVDTSSSLIATNVNNVALCVALNYMSYAGVGSNFSNVIANTSNPFAGITSSYTMLSKAA